MQVRNQQPANGESMYSSGNVSLPSPAISIQAEPLSALQGGQSKSDTESSARGGRRSQGCRYLQAEDYEQALYRHACRVNPENGSGDIAMPS